MRDDDATRHLAAAAHVDERFADEVIEEFLTEPRRSVPPSPGTDLVVVLTEAIIARRHRVLRDCVVLALFVALLVAQWPFSLFWLLVAAGGAVAEGMILARRRHRGFRGRSTAALGLALIVGAITVVGLVVWWFMANLVAHGHYADGTGVVDGNGLSTTLTVLFATALAGVLLWDRVQLRALLRERFARRPWYSLGGYPVPWPPHGAAWYANRLQLIARSAGSANTHVYDGYKAFVGSGALMQSWSMSIRLRPAGDGAGHGRLTPAAVYQAIIGEVLDMRGSDSLAPGQRLGTLRHSYELVTPAGALLEHAGEPLATTVLPHADQPPSNLIDQKLIDQLIGRSPEWARPYLCFRVEGWRKELVVSTYLHAGCDDDTLYLEWRGYQLNPVKADYQVEEMDLNHLSTALLQAVILLLKLPFTVPGRVRTLWRAARDAMGVATVETYDPASCYGARRSVREIAADDRTNLYFQEADGVRFLTLLQARTLAGVDRALLDHGLSTEEFAGQRGTVVNAAVLDRPASRSSAGIRIGPIHLGAHRSAGPAYAEDR